MLSAVWVKASVHKDGGGGASSGGVTVSSVSAGNQSQLFICEPASLAGLLPLRTSLSSSCCLCLVTAVCV